MFHEDSGNTKWFVDLPHTHRFSESLHLQWKRPNSREAAAPRWKLVMAHKMVVECSNDHSAEPVHWGPPDTSLGTFLQGAHTHTACRWPLDGLLFAETLLSDQNPFLLHFTRLLDNIHIYICTASHSVHRLPLIRTLQASFLLFGRSIVVYPKICHNNNCRIS